MGYQSDYARTVADIYGQLGQGQAQARLQQGSAWANAFGQIGQTVAAIPGQLAAQKQQARQNQLTDLQMQQATDNIKRAQRKDAEDMGLADLMGSAYVGGKFNPEALSQEAAARGMTHLVPEIIKTITESQQALLVLEGNQLLSAEQKVEAQKNFLAPYAISIVEHGFNPKQLLGVFKTMRLEGVPEAMVAAWETAPAEAFANEVLRLVPKPKAPEAFNLSPGEVRNQPTTDQFGRPVLGPDGQPTYTKITGPTKPTTLDEQLAAAVAAKNVTEVSRIRNEIARNAAATRAPREEPKISPNEAISATMRLRQQYATETKAARDTRVQFEQMKSALAAVKNGSEAAGSQGVLVTFQKILDPTSVVRESEYARSSSGLSLLAQIQGKYDSIVKGGAGVPVKELEDFVNLAKTFSDNQARAANATTEQIESIITDYGLNRKSIIIDLDEGVGGAGGGGGVPTPTGMVRMRDTNNVEQFVPSANVAMAEAGGWKRSGG